MLLRVPVIEGEAMSPDIVILIPGSLNGRQVRIHGSSMTDIVKAAVPTLETPYPLIREREVRQRLSHRKLIHDVLTVDPPSRRSRPTPLNAIVVPSARRASHLEHSIRLAAESGTLLVVLASRDCVADEVAFRAASAVGCRALVAEVPEGYGHEYLTHQTSAHADLRSANAGRESDLSLKRNIGLILARLMGWTKIVYLDDDIFGVNPLQLTKLSAQLEDHQVAGLMTREYPDNSVVCHAIRFCGANQDNFVGGAALAVNVNYDHLPLSFFPDNITRIGSSLSTMPRAATCPVSDSSSSQVQPIQGSPAGCT